MILPLMLVHSPPAPIRSPLATSSELAIQLDAGQSGWECVQ